MLFRPSSVRSEPIRKHFTQMMSMRAVEMLKEDIESLGPVRIKDVEAAQQEIIATVRVLQSEGTLSIGESGKDEYVVQMIRNCGKSFIPGEAFQ